MKEKEKVLRFDPVRYMKSIRQKARPEWFDVTRRKGSKSVRITDLTMYTLDEKDLLLSGALLNLEYGRKYGLVGLNGCGKTTLLRRISRYDLKQFPAHLRVLHVEQEILGDDQTVLDYVLSCDVVRAELVEKEQQILNQKNELGDTKYEQSNVLDKKLQEIYEKMRELDVFDVDHKAKVNEINYFYFKVLEGLGFRPEMYNWPTKKLSGGWRMRASLAGALFVCPDVLLLDEPTNHLDFPSVVWLENYLREEFQNTLLVVSHDREFLNSVVDRILHMEKQQIREYPVNYYYYYYKYLIIF
ncbi:ATP-binding protein [Reticulomyxa filosa]|uniref:ATP-binding protein n=1 Tax=Reticulomyxa filosa TaxID=46433 RepID=X6M9T1_RETFI|nr:ATP-binding protein [Reticulomyxa filosa]|eukprot:ETO10371.1 ATP-binding protein [Reticulomyxa filosa]